MPAWESEQQSHAPPPRISVGGAPVLTTSNKKASFEVRVIPIDAKIHDTEKVVGLERSDDSNDIIVTSPPCLQFDSLFESPRRRNLDDGLVANLHQVCTCDLSFF